MTARRFSIIWPVLILIAAALWIVQALGDMPAVAADLLARAWPILLVAAGLMLLIGRRVRFGNFIALALSLVLVGAVTVTAYSQQANREVADKQQPFEQLVDPATTSVAIKVTTLLAGIEIKPGDSTKTAISGQYVGSRESRVTSDYQIDGSTGTFTFVEGQNSGIPSLGGLGRGKLTLFLPVGLTVNQLTVTVAGHGDVFFDGAGTALSDLTLSTDKGAITLGTLPASLTNLHLTGTGSLDLDTSATSLKDLTITLAGGSLTIKLSDKSGLNAALKASGDVAITVPQDMAANVKLLNGAANNPTYNQADYILNIDKVLVSRRASEPQMQIQIDAGGHATIR